MRAIIAPIPFIILACLASCEKKVKPEMKKETVSDELKHADTPILPIKKGDYWKYKVRVEIPAGITSEGSSAVEIETEKTRTFLGKVEVSENHPPTDAFDVVVPGQPVGRELVEIKEDRILMRGSSQPETLGSKPIWMEPAIAFVVAGMRPGQQITPFSIQEGASKRSMKVIAREAVVVPAGSYPAIRLLMTGNDGQFEVRRTTWFAPRIGIVKEEKTRYAGDKLIFRETTELIETSVKGK